jgi:PHD-finger
LLLLFFFLVKNSIKIYQYFPHHIVMASVRRNRVKFNNNIKRLNRQAEELLNVRIIASNESKRDAKRSNSAKSAKAHYVDCIKYLREYASVLGTSFDMNTHIDTSVSDVQSLHARTFIYEWIERVQSVLSPSVEAPSSWQNIQDCLESGIKCGILSHVLTDLSFVTDKMPEWSSTDPLFNTKHIDTAIASDCVDVNVVYAQSNLAQTCKELAEKWLAVHEWLQAVRVELARFNSDDDKAEVEAEAEAEAEAKAVCASSDAALVSVNAWMSHLDTLVQDRPYAVTVEPESTLIVDIVHAVRSWHSICVDMTKCQASQASVVRKRGYVVGMTAATTARKQVQSTAAATTIPQTQAAQVDTVSSIRGAKRKAMVQLKSDEKNHKRAQVSQTDNDNDNVNDNDSDSIGVSTPSDSKPNLSSIVQHLYMLLRPNRSEQQVPIDVLQVLTKSCRSNTDIDSEVLGRCASEWYSKEEFILAGQIAATVPISEEHDTSLTHLSHAFSTFPKWQQDTVSEIALANATLKQSLPFQHLVYHVIDHLGQRTSLAECKDLPNSDSLMAQFDQPDVLSAIYQHMERLDRLWCESRSYPLESELSAELWRCLWRCVTLVSLWTHSDFPILLGLSDCAILAASCFKFVSVPSKDYEAALTRPADMQPPDTEMSHHDYVNGDDNDDNEDDDDDDDDDDNDDDDDDNDDDDELRHIMTRRHGRSQSDLDSFSTNFIDKAIDQSIVDHFVGQLPTWLAVDATVRRCRAWVAATRRICRTSRASLEQMQGIVDTITNKLPARVPEAESLRSRVFEASILLKVIVDRARQVYANWDEACADEDIELHTADNLDASLRILDTEIQEWQSKARALRLSVRFHPELKLLRRLSAEVRHVNDTVDALFTPRPRHLTLETLLSSSCKDLEVAPRPLREGIPDTRNEWCVCRRSDVKKDMIMCDTCEQWYHAECIGIDARSLNSIGQYECMRCCERHGRQYSHHLRGGVPAQLTVNSPTYESIEETVNQFSDSEIKFRMLQQISDLRTHSHEFWCEVMPDWLGWSVAKFGANDRSTLMKQHDRIQTIRKIALQLPVQLAGTSRLPISKDVIYSALDVLEWRVSVYSSCVSLDSIGKDAVHHNDVVTMSTLSDLLTRASKCGISEVSTSSHLVDESAESAEPAPSGPSGPSGPDTSSILDTTAVDILDKWLLTQTDSTDTAMGDAKSADSPVANSMIDVSEWQSLIRTQLEHARQEVRCIRQTLHLVETIDDQFGLAMIQTPKSKPNEPHTLLNMFQASNLVSLLGRCELRLPMPLKSAEHPDCVFGPRFPIVATPTATLFYVRSGLLCLCGKPFDATYHMVPCQQCCAWFHSHCVGADNATSEQYLDNSHFVCPICVRRVHEACIRL